MKERPMLFSSPMVRAILDGSKTQTRRVVKHHLPTGPNDIRTYTGMPEIYGAGGGWLPLSCSYGVPGDQIWVRETWAPVAGIGEISTPEKATYACFPDGSQRFRSGEYYRGTLKAVDKSKYPTGWKWNPSIHMPRWASRITLEITGVRAERLKEISEADAIAEGVVNNGTDGRPGHIHRTLFRELWESINGPGSWDANPYVWVIEFRKVTP